jgi:outer membrane protein assembly factor BamB
MPAFSRIAAVPLSLILIATPAVASPAPLWDHPGYDAEDSHYNPSETAIHAGSIGRLTEKWRVGLRTSDASCGGFSAPVVSGGRIHVSDQLGISAYSTDNGKILWWYDGDDPMDSETPRLAVTDGLLIVAGGDCNSQSDPDGNLLALDARTGLPRWRQRIDIPIHVTTGTSAGVDITTGRVRWSRKATWTAQAAHPGSTRFYVTDRAGSLSAVQVGDGALKWTVGAATETIAVDRERLYRLSGEGVEALSVHDGHRVWAAGQQGEAVQPVLAGGLLYAGGPVLDAANGTVMGPAFGGRVIVAGGQLHQVRDGVLTTLR